MRGKCSSIITHFELHLISFINPLLKVGWPLVDAHLGGWGFAVGLALAGHPYQHVDLWNSKCPITIILPDRR